MKKPAIYLASSALLLACNNVSTSTSDPGTTDPGTTGSADTLSGVALSTIRINGEGVGAGYTLDVNGNALKVDFSNEEPALTVDGETQQAGSFDLGNVPLYGFYEVDEQRKAFAGVPDIAGVRILGFSLSDIFGEHQGTEWNYDHVAYDYMIGRGDAAPENHSSNGEDGAGGTISYDGTKWSAKLGDVSLTGTVEGSNVSGTAALEDMSGKFLGYDGSLDFGSYEGDEDDDPSGVSFGGFAGDNGDANIFAGGWMGGFGPEDDDWDDDWDDD